MSSNLKKILLLGGSAQQIVAIETAKSLGYQTILCDYLADNPGQFSADVFHLISTTDKESILQVAREEGVSGIIAYASDPAAPTAAYVAERLGLPTNPYKSVDILCDKAKFRAFLSQNDIMTPKSFLIDKESNLESVLPALCYPLIVKPVDSSGSKGVTVLKTADGLEGAVALAMSFSRKKEVILEDFIEMKHRYLIGGDIFVNNGEVILWGLMNCHRNSRVNPLVPVGKSFPLALGEDDIRRVKSVLSDIVKKLGIKSGPMNVELIIDKKNNVWPIDIGPRSGGNMIPDLLSDIFGVNIIEMTIMSAMGEKIKGSARNSDHCYATHNLHSACNGEYVGVYFDGDLQKHIYREHLYKREGDIVERFSNASKALGIIFMRFPDLKEMEGILDGVEDLYSVVLR